ncbi:MAG: hypothetical protein K2K08_01600, partial [Paramuribaculum sp.]|nr:hypothetical protein [Paramuribaculum sp.]
IPSPEGERSMSYSIIKVLHFDLESSVPLQCLRRRRRKFLQPSNRLFILMNWIILILAGLMEVAFTFCLGKTKVIVFGRARFVVDEKEKIDALQKLSEKYSDGIDPTVEINKFLKVVTVIEITIDGVTGKEAIELTRNRTI